MRSRARLIAAVALVAVGAAALGWGPGVAYQLRYPRDEAAYREYVAAHIDGWASSSDPGGPARDRAWAAENPDLVLAEGDKACAWLSRRLDAPDVDPTRRFEFEAVYQDYLRSVSDTRPVAMMSQGTIVAGAWAYLCRPTRRDKTAPTGADGD